MTRVPVSLARRFAARGGALLLGAALLAFANRAPAASAPAAARAKPTTHAAAPASPSSAPVPPASRPEPPARVAVARPALLVPAAEVRFAASDGAALLGRWYAAGPHASSVVLAPSHRGPVPELDSLALELQRRGFNALTFVLRDGIIADRSRDSLGMIAMASRWVTDLVGAIHTARARTDSTSYLFVWGQGTGGDMALAAVARDDGASDGLVVAELHRIIEDAQNELGTAQIPEALALQKAMLDQRDEPTSAAARLRVPVLAILDGPGAGGENDVSWQVTRRVRGRLERWLRPGVATAGLHPGAAEADTVSAWFLRVSQFPRTH